MNFSTILESNEAQNLPHKKICTQDLYIIGDHIRIILYTLLGLR